jgi:hypothetical protein
MDDVREALRRTRIQPASPVAGGGDTVIAEFELPERRWRRRLGLVAMAVAIVGTLGALLVWLASRGAAPRPPRASGATPVAAERPRSARLVPATRPSVSPGPAASAPALAARRDAGLLAARPQGPAADARQPSVSPTSKRPRPARAYRHPARPTPAPATATPAAKTPTKDARAPARKGGGLTVDPWEQQR